MVRRRAWGWYTSPSWLVGFADALRALNQHLSRAFRLTPEGQLRAMELGLRHAIRVFGVDGGPTAEARTQVAQQLERMKRYDEARLLREEALASNIRHMGSHHKQTLNAQLWLANNLALSRSIDGAKALASHVVEAGQVSLSPDDPVMQNARRLLSALDQDTP